MTFAAKHLHGGGKTRQIFDLSYQSGLITPCRGIIEGRRKYRGQLATNEPRVEFTQANYTSFACMKSVIINRPLGIYGEGCGKGSYEEAAEDRNMLERESSEISLDLLRGDRVENFFQ